MNLRELARMRKTVRNFKSEKPDLQDLLYALDVMKEAPSGKNDQPWNFLLISDEAKKKTIREICEKHERTFYEKSTGKLKKWLEEKGFSWRKEFLTQAPYLLVGFSKKASPFARESFWLAIGYLLLALEEKGLSSVTYTPTDFVEVARFVGAPENLRLEVILPVGYSQDGKKKWKRKSIEEILTYDSFQ